MKIGLYSLGREHPIDKYFQVISLFNLMIKSPDFETVILVDSTGGGGRADYQLKKRYSSCSSVKFVDLKEISINDIGLDAVIIIDPYSRPRTPYEEIKVPIIYKEYGVAGVEKGSGLLINKPVYRYADLIITDNEYYKSLILNKYPGKDVVVGSPAFDYIFDKYDKDSRFKDNKINLLWTPHHSIESQGVYDNILGGTYSTFLSYKDFICNELPQINKDFILHVKFHPVLSKRYNKYCETHGICDDFKSYVSRLRESWCEGRVYIHDHEDYHNLFANADVLVNDSLSFIQEWIPTLKPIIHLSDKNQAEYSPYGQYLIENCCTKVSCIEDLKEVFTNLKSSVICKSTYCQLKVTRSLLIDPFTANSESLLRLIKNKFSKEKSL